MCSIFVVGCYFACVFVFGSVWGVASFDELFLVWLTNERHLAIFPAGTIVRYPHHCKSLTHCEKNLNLHRT